MADNLIAFFEENSYRPHSGSHWEYNRYRFQRFGEILADTIVEVDTEGTSGSDRTGPQSDYYR